MTAFCEFFQKIEVVIKKDFDSLKDELFNEFKFEIVLNEMPKDAKKTDI